MFILELLARALELCNRWVNLGKDDVTGIIYAGLFRAMTLL